MVHRSPLRRSVFLGLTFMVMAGCAGLSGSGQQAAAPSAPRTPGVASARTDDAQVSTVAVEKPQPAPPLYIAGTAAAAVPVQESSPAAPVQPTEVVTSLPPAEPVAAPAPVAVPVNLQLAEIPTRVPEVALPAQPLQGAASVSALREIQRKAALRFAGMDCYMMRLRRREVQNNQMRPEEIMLCKFRRQPISVYLKWLSEEGKNREVVYVKNHYGNLIHTLTAAGDIPLFPAGRRFSVSPDSPLVKARTRHPISEAGMGPVIARFGRLVEAVEKGDISGGTARYMGKNKRPEYDHELTLVHQGLAPGNDPLLPRGGNRWWFFDPANDLPVLILTYDDANREVEYYCHDRFVFQLRLTDDDFNPDRLWPKVGDR